jgi:RimJ/RimL family protein N-acetyltransferase
MRVYKALKKQEFKKDEYCLKPIRHEDRFEIMKWRNEQIHHLRQIKPLTIEVQEKYFEDVIAPLFQEERPNQILFSFLRNEKLVGYGGLVHINYEDKNAELSFVMKTELQKLYFEKFWIVYLDLIKRPAFRELNLRKIYTYAFDVRERLYPALESAGFILEARLREHCYINEEYKDVLVHSFWNPTVNLKMRYAKEEDVDLYFRWANDTSVRQNSFNPEPILFENHSDWFKEKLKSDRANLYIFEVLGKPVGQFRIDKVDDAWEIDYSVDKSCRGLGVGKAIISLFLTKNSNNTLLHPLKAVVKNRNIASHRVFQDLGFTKAEEQKETTTYLYQS